MKGERRDLDAELLDELRSAGCDHTSGLAQMVDAPLSTVRRHLEAMQERGLIDGILHDERDILPNGRRRVYWSMKWVERGRTGVAQR